MIDRIAGKIVGRASRELAHRGYFRELWYPKYQFQYFPRQLCFLAKCLEDTADVDGAIVEIGCAYGTTTTFLYEYMVDSGIDRDYHCIDTFSGFTKEDIAVETQGRGKSHSYEGEFTDNDIAWFKESLARRHITDINVIKADICALDPARLPEKIAFCLLDVDLYQPVKVGLEKVYDRISPGGMIVVDDCWTKSKHMWVEGVAKAYDGAMQAYKEFVAEKGLPEEYAETKLALIRR